MPDVFYNNISLSGEDNEIVQFMSDITLVGDRAYYTNRHGYLSLIGNKFQCNNMNKFSFDTILYKILAAFCYILSGNIHQLILFGNGQVDTVKD